MTIEWRGEGCFEIRETGDRFSILTELPSRDSGLSAPRTKTDVLLSIWGDLEDTLFGKEDKSRFVISGPGEFEIKETFIKGIKLSKEGSLIKSAYLISTEEIKIGYLGEINKKEIKPEVVGFFEEADILMVPIGGNGMLDAESATEIINQIEPKIAIPMYFKIPNLKRRADSLETFLKEIGSNSKSQDKLLIKKKDLNFEETRVFPLLAI